MAVLIRKQRTESEYVAKLTEFHGWCACDGRIEECPEAQKALKGWRKQNAAGVAAAS